MKLYQLKAVCWNIRDRIQWYRDFNEINSFSETDRKILELIILDSICQEVIFSPDCDTTSSIYENWHKVVKNMINHLTNR